MYVFKELKSIFIYSCMYVCIHQCTKYVFAISHASQSV